MKAISNALHTHLAQAVTTLAMCWKIVRTDGVVYTFTTCDIDLVVDGLTYLSVAGFSRSAIATGSTGSVDNLEVTGFFVNTGILEQDLKNRLFDYASVFLFVVNWADLTQGICRMRAGWLGETVRATNGGFTAELRGLTQALVQEFGPLYTPVCRADLGDAQCKIPIKPPLWSAGAPYPAGAYVQALTQPDDAHLVAIFQALGPGISGGTEPSWNTTVGATTADNTLTWTSKLPWRLIGSVTTPISQHMFTSSALTLPAAPAVNTTNAIISFRNNISANTDLVVSDGVSTAHYDQTFVSGGFFFRDQTLAAIKASALQMTVTEESGNLVLTNHSGALGSIHKTGDVLGAIVIQDFGSPLLDGGTVTWLSGLNAGTAMEMKTYEPSSSTVTLWLGTHYAIQAGDRFFYHPGCDKRRDTCRTVFNNIVNMRAEPDMPGTDRVLSYPDTGA